MEALTPIDEEPSEDQADEDQPITMIPRIMHTAPSPTIETNPIVSSGASINSGGVMKSMIIREESTNGSAMSSSGEVKQIESVL